MVLPQKEQEEQLEESLLDYLAFPCPPTVRDGPTWREVLGATQRLASALADPPGGAQKPPIWPETAGGGRPSSWAKPGLSARFFRLVSLPRSSVVATLTEWWAAGAKDGVVTVARRLRLGPPRGSAGVGWTMDGRVRRLTRWHWVPVIVELWPLHGHWMMTMTPQAHVIASRRYFRTGHLALDRLTTELERRPPATGSCRDLDSGRPRL